MKKDIILVFLNSENNDGRLDRAFEIILDSTEDNKILKEKNNEQKK